MHLGLDFGTTHTSATWYDGRLLHRIPLDSQHSNPHLLRSMIYIDRAQRIALGREAVERFLREDTGRPVAYQKKVVGTIENTVARQTRSPLEPEGPITIVHDVVIDEDIAAQGRLLQSIKTGLRSPSYQGTHVFGRYYTLEELIARILTHVRTQAEAFLQQDVTAVVLGRPVRFVEDDDAADRQAEAKLHQAAQLAGFREVAFVLEPVAAASFYFAQVQRAETVLVFDFGGGTLDLTVMRREASGRTGILASHGVSLGGDDLDSAIMEHHIARHFGTESYIDVFYNDEEIPFPAELARLLYHWPTIPVLSRPKHLALIQRAQQHGGDRAAFAALERLVTRNYGFALFEAIERGKQTLSTQPQAAVMLQMAEINLSVDITRRAFNDAIAGEITQARRGVRAVLARAGLSPEAIDAVITTGGSSVIPAFQAVLKEELRRSTRVQTDLFGSVVGGLAILASDGV